MGADQQAVTSEHDATKSAGSFDGNEKETAPWDDADKAQGATLTKCDGTAALRILIPRES
jgi:hypothetical protein